MHFKAKNYNSTMLWINLDYWSQKLGDQNVGTATLAGKLTAGMLWWFVDRLFAFRTAPFGTSTWIKSLTIQHSSAFVFITTAFLSYKMGTLSSTNASVISCDHEKCYMILVGAGGLLTLGPAQCWEINSANIQLIWIPGSQLLKK